MDPNSPHHQLFRTDAPAEGIIRVKGSKFLAFAYPVSSQEEVGEWLNKLKKKYYDASHHCYAWRLGEEGDTSFANDAGEPAHTAGPPILAAIRSAKLTQILVVVVRYFGGTKLGRRGLIENYRKAAAIAIEKCSLLPVIPRVVFTIRYSYEQTADIQRLLHHFDFELVETSYTSDCMLRIRIAKEDFPRLQELFGQINLSVAPE